MSNLVLVQASTNAGRITVSSSSLAGKCLRTMWRRAQVSKRESPRVEMWSSNEAPPLLMADRTETNHIIQRGLQCFLELCRKGCPEFSPELRPNEVTRFEDVDETLLQSSSRARVLVTRFERLVDVIFMWMSLHGKTDPER